MKINEQSSNRVRRAIPSSVAVVATQDIFNIKLIALEPISRTDISVRIIASQPEFYKTLRVNILFFICLLSKRSDIYKL